MIVSIETKTEEEKKAYYREKQRECRLRFIENRKAKQRREYRFKKVTLELACKDCFTGNEQLKIPKQRKGV